MRKRVGGAYKVTAHMHVVGRATKSHDTGFLVTYIDRSYIEKAALACRGLMRASEYSFHMQPSLLLLLLLLRLFSTETTDTTVISNKDDEKKSALRVCKLKSQEPQLKMYI